MPAATVRLAPNLPVHIDVAFADIVGGKFGAQLRLKGKVNGADSYVYVDHVEAMNSLLTIGAIGTIPQYDPDNLPEKGVQVTLSKKSLIVTKAQAAGEKYGTYTITTNGAPSVSAPTAPAAAAPTPQPAGSALPEPMKLTALYLESLTFVLTRVVPSLEALDESRPVDQQAVMASVATVFIARCKQLGIN